jgi:hypothetical protein
LQAFDLAAKGFGADGGIGAGSHQAAARKHRHVHAGGKMLAGRLDDNDARQRIGVDMANDPRQIGPEIGGHRIMRFGTFQRDRRDLVSDSDVKAGR